MPHSVMAIDNTPLCRLVLQDIGTAPTRFHSLGELHSIRDMPTSLPTGSGLLINSSIADFNQLPPCPLAPEQVAILVSTLTPFSRQQLADLGYHRVIDKDRGFAALCFAVRNWQQSLTSRPFAGQPPAELERRLEPLIEPLKAQLHQELSALIDSKLLRIEGDIHAHLEQVVTRWLTESLEPRLGAQLAERLPGLVSTALSQELDRLTSQR